MEKPTNYYLNRIIKDNINSNGMKRHHMPPKTKHLERYITFVVSLPKVHNLNLIMRKHQTNPTEGYPSKYLAYTP